jgi:hypothetical protein
VTIIDRKLPLGSVWSGRELFLEAGFHLLERDVCQRDQAVSSEWHSLRGAVTKKSRQRNGTVLHRCSFKKFAKPRGNPSGHEGIAIAPKINPRLGIGDKLSSQCFTDRAVSLPETLFSDRIPG